MNKVTLVPGKISSLKQEIGLYSIALNDSVPSVKKSVNNRLFFISFLSLILGDVFSWAISSSEKISFNDFVSISWFYSKVYKIYK